MRKILALSFLVLSFATPALASGYVWEDKANGFAFSFPDNWGVQTAQSPTMLVRVAGPLNEDAATCNVKAEHDGRLLIYPKRLMETAVKETLTQSFWEDEILAQGHENAKITAYIAPAGLGGKGDATAVRAAYAQHGMSMYAQMIASIYGGKRFVISCSARADQFEKYAPLFATIMGSVDLDSRYHPFATGYYRDFLADPIFYQPVDTRPGSAYQKDTYWLTPN